MRPLIILTTIAIITAFSLDYVLAFVGMKLTRVPQGFPPFTCLPVLAGTFGGPVLASLVYVGIRATSAVPDRLFFFVTLTALILSLGLPLRLSFTHSPRFAGVTPAAQMVLVLMHAVVATVSFILLTSKSDYLK